MPDTGRGRAVRSLLDGFRPNLAAAARAPVPRSVHGGRMTCVERAECGMRGPCDLALWEDVTARGSVCRWLRERRERVGYVVIALGSNMHIVARAHRRGELARCFATVLGSLLRTVEFPGIDQPMFMMSLPCGDISVSSSPRMHPMTSSRAWCLGSSCAPATQLQCSRRQLRQDFLRSSIRAICTTSSFVAARRSSSPQRAEHGGSGYSPQGQRCQKLQFWRQRVRTTNGSTGRAATRRLPDNRDEPVAGLGG